MKALVRRGFRALGLEILSRRNYDDLCERLSLLKRERRKPISVVNVGRLLFLLDLVKKTEDVEGDIVECGVGRGTSFVMLAELIKVLDLAKNLWGFDSFEGFPEPSEEDAGGSGKKVEKGGYRVDQETVHKLLWDCLQDDLFLRTHVTLVKGFFEEVLSQAAMRIPAVSLLHLDVDLAQSYTTCLEVLYPKVSPGGVIAFDEYWRESTKYPGARKAIDRFFEGKAVRFEKDRFYGKFYAVKEEQAPCGCGGVEDERGG